MIVTAPGRHLILYDGVCGLCNRFNTFVLIRDSRALFHFAPLQSEFGRLTLQKYHLHPDALDTFYVIADYQSAEPHILSKARAAIFVAKELGGIWKVSRLLGMLPSFVLNPIYDLIARHRYRVYGRYDQCLVPKPEYRNRFVGL
jgi:predicted DCC family thiol-disulfide oxidoreductase YuxK